jgi:hypothetical protein
MGICTSITGAEDADCSCVKRNIRIPARLPRSILRLSRPLRPIIVSLLAKINNSFLKQQDEPPTGVPVGGCFAEQEGLLLDI